MKCVNPKNQSFTWQFIGDKNFNTNDKKVSYKLKDYKPSALFRNTYDLTVNINTIIASGWDREDFLNAIIIWRNFNYINNYDLLCLKDWEDNLDHYLNQATIQNIIE